MQLDQLYITPHIQDLYAEIIATEDIVASYGTDCELLKTNQPNIGEVKQCHI